MREGIKLQGVFMNIADFIGRYKNHPVLFIGAGLSLRYLENSYGWLNLLSHIAYELTEDEEYFLDLKSKCKIGGKYELAKLATLLENDFNQRLEKERNGKFKNINDLFYESMRKDQQFSRFKIYISELLKQIKYRDLKLSELAELKRTRKNVGSIITTNYDKLIEDVFEFEPLVGNNILLSNPYGAVYKIHGCVSEIDKIIINEDDYNDFNREYALIRAQLLSIFIHNPIIFLGYSIEDYNIRKILETVFSYVDPNSDVATKIKNNFLLIEWESDSANLEITDYDFDAANTIIRINKLKTDDFLSVYSAISNLHLPVSAMDIRKVQNIVKNIYAGGDIKVTITEDLDELRNSDKILAIGSANTIRVEYQTSAEMIKNYFNIIDESNSQILAFIDKHNISNSQYFPIFGFSKLNTKIVKESSLKENQRKNIENAVGNIPQSQQISFNTIHSIINDENIATTRRSNVILWNAWQRHITLSDLEQFLRSSDLKPTDKRKLLCVYDMLKYESQ